jgi:hypothetical protein
VIDFSSLNSPLQKLIALFVRTSPTPLLQHQIYKTLSIDRNKCHESLNFLVEKNIIQSKKYCESEIFYCSDASKRGSDASKRGSGTSKRGSDASKRGSGASKRGSDASKRGSGASKRGSGASKRGSNAPEASTSPSPPFPPSFPKISAQQTNRSYDQGYINNNIYNLTKQTNKQKRK